MLSKLRRNLADYGLGATLLKAVRIGSNRILTPIKRMTQREFVRSRYGVWMQANWADNTFRACIEGAYGPFLQRMLESIYPPPPPPTQKGASCSSTSGPIRAFIR